MKYRFISDHRETFKVGRMCKLLNVSRSGYYDWQKRPESRRSRENRALGDKIRVLHIAGHGIYGSQRVHRDLIDAGVRCGKNRVARIMRNAGIQSQTKRKFKATTNSKHNLPVAQNLLEQNFTVEARITPGSAILPISRPTRAGFTWPFSWIFTVARSSVGPPLTG